MPRIRLVALGLAVSALAANGCGKSSSTDATRTQSSATQASTTQIATQPAATTGTKNQEPNAVMLDNANELCERINSRRSSEKAETDSAIATVAKEQAKFEQTVAVEMAKLTPTAPSLVNAWKQIVAAAQVLTNDTAKIGEYAKAGQLSSPTGRALIAQRHAVENHAQLIAAHVHIKQCEVGL